MDTNSHRKTGRRTAVRCMVGFMMALLSMVSRAEVPDSISGLTMWFMSTSLTVTNNTPVSLWQDNSPLSNNATQPTAAYQPIFWTRTSSNGKRPSLNFNGSSSNSLGGSFPILTNATVFAVIRSRYNNFRVQYHNQAGNDSRWGFRTSSAFSSGLWYRVTFQIQFQPSTNFALRMDGINQSTVQDPQNHLYDLGVNCKPILCYSTYNTQEQGLFLGNSSASGTPNGSPTQAFYTTACRHIGRYESANNKYFDGEISELIVYNRYLNLTEVQTVEQYLWDKHFVSPKGTVVMIK